MGHPARATEILSARQEEGGERARISLYQARIPLMTEISPAQTLSSEEQEQLQQTVEMFEVITQANPQDIQSMEILKEAYAKLGKKTEALGVARRLADSHVEMSQFSSALLEYEYILEHDPENKEIIAALGEVEKRLQAIQSEVQQDGGSGEIGINLDFRSVVTGGGSLIATKSTQAAERVALRGTIDVAALDAQLAAGDDGNEALAKFLAQHRLVPADVVTPALMAVRKRNTSREQGKPASSLIAEMVTRGGVDLEQLLCGILDRAKFAYLPLDYYDIDRQIVRMLPESVTLGRLMVPFDVVSRTMMVALANPFDAVGKEAVQQLIDYNIQWHLSSPAAITKALEDAYRK
jgi:tetratricopeptide (TPR) repeat protein